MWILVLSLLGEEVRDREGSNFPWKAEHLQVKHQEGTKGETSCFHRQNKEFPLLLTCDLLSWRTPQDKAMAGHLRKQSFLPNSRPANALLNPGTCLQASPVLAMNKVLLGFCRCQELGSCFNRHEENNGIWQTCSSKCLGFTSVYNLMCLRIFVQIHVIFH